MGWPKKYGSVNVEELYKSNSKMKKIKEKAVKLLKSTSTRVLMEGVLGGILILIGNMVYGDHPNNPEGFAEFSKVGKIGMIIFLFALADMVVNILFGIGQSIWHHIQVWRKKK